MKIAFDIEYDDARELRKHLGTIPFDVVPPLYEALNQAIENADEARYDRLEERRIL